MDGLEAKHPSLYQSRILNGPLLRKPVDANKRAAAVLHRQSDRYYGAFQGWAESAAGQKRLLWKQLLTTCSHKSRWYDYADHTSGFCGFGITFVKNINRFFPVKKSTKTPGQSLPDLSGSLGKHDSNEAGCFLQPYEFVCLGFFRRIEAVLAGHRSPVGNPNGIGGIRAGSPVFRHAVLYRCGRHILAPGIVKRKVCWRKAVSKLSSRNRASHPLVFLCSPQPLFRC